MNALLDFHAIWAWVVIIGNGLAGLWALAAWRVPNLRTRALWWFVAFANCAIGIQVLVGVGLLAIEKLQAPFFHYFYGIVATVVASLLFAYKTRMKRRLYLLYGIGGLLLMGVGIRAMIMVLK